MFNTSNLYLAAFLYALDESAFTGIESGEDNYSQFIFKSKIQSKDTTDIEKEYWNNGGLIAPKKYANAIRSLKERIKN